VEQHRINAKLLLVALFAEPFGEPSEAVAVVFGGTGQAGELSACGLDDLQYLAFCCGVQLECAELFFEFVLHLAVSLSLFTDGVYSTLDIPGCVKGSVMPTSSFPNVLMWFSSSARISSSNRRVV
jgi:hypothetical protein